MARQGVVTKLETKRGTPSRANAVYFVKAFTLGHIKIGKADCVYTRFAKLRMISPDSLLMLGAIVSEDATALERELHQRFGAQRLHGEWFRSSEELLAYIAEHARTPPPQKDWRETRPPRQRVA